MEIQKTTLQEGVNKKSNLRFFKITDWRNRCLLQLFSTILSCRMKIYGR
jgi:hypothetical protein